MKETRTGRENSERPRSVEEWVAQIESAWKAIPEFEVDPEKLRHLAIICDGNRRAARERGFHDWDGHRAGVELIRQIARAGREWGIRTLTFWTWSTENWGREKKQTEVIMGLAAQHLPDPQLLEEFKKEKVRFTHLGRKDRLPERVRSAIEHLEEETRKFDRYQVNLAMDYGGLDETARAIGKIINGVQKGTLDFQIIQENPQVILGFLDTANQALPDLIIRTGTEEGEISHTSGFMALQSSYAGWTFLPDLLPDLTPEALLQSITEFSEYKRRMGR